MRCARPGAARLRAGLEENEVESGVLAKARYEPTWAQRRESLGAYLAFFRFTDLQNTYRTPLDQFRY